jgi:hypothetical protein
MHVARTNQSRHVQCHSTNYNLRHNEFKLYLPKANTEYLKKSIGFCGVKLWNELCPAINLRIADSLDSFNTLFADSGLV